MGREVEGWKWRWKWEKNVRVGLHDGEVERVGQRIGIKYERTPKRLEIQVKKEIRKQQELIHSIPYDSYSTSHA